MPSMRRLVVSSWLVLLPLLAAGTPAHAQTAPTPTPPHADTPTLSPTPPTSNLRDTNESRVYRAVKDAVVNISSTKIVTARVGTGDEVFDRFFGGTIRQVPAQSLGSGFVIHPSGYIITNEHVVDQATDVNVVFSDGAKLEAQVLATDSEHDLAVLKVTPKKPLPAITLGSSDDLMIGEPVYAIGNPFGYAGTMTRGIVSALDRTLEAGPDKSYKGLIQTDASINPGNSGGPLLNAYGQVIGINTAIRADAHGIGFAIAVSRMRDILPTFLNPEGLNRAEIGFTVEEKRTVTPPAEVHSHVIVKSVQPGSAAAKVGLAPGMRILAIDKAPAANIVETLVALSNTKSGDTLALSVSTDTPKGLVLSEIKIPVTQAPPPESETLLATKLGVEALTVTPAVAKKYKLAIAQGVLITALKPDTPAAAAGLKVGDILYQLGPYYITSTDDLARLLKTVKEEVDVRLGIIRGPNRGRGTVRLK
jgi:serine protease Do